MHRKYTANDKMNKHDIYRELRLHDFLGNHGEEKLSFPQTCKRSVASSRENWQRLTTLYVAPELMVRSGSVNLQTLV